MRLLRNRILLKFFAVFFCFEILVSTVLPTFSWALTGGPTAPEATSFEPIDTTDIVDLKTGDFTYNIPLLEVPGPAGGYPLSLSYHAGIQPDQEASWTGLGFTLNPGSIFRLVNGYPDDHENVGNVDRSYWKGGTEETYTVGLSYGIANGASVSAGLTFASDTYKGRGTGGYIGVGIGSPNVGENIEFGISPYGDMYTSTGISLGIGSAAADKYGNNLLHTSGGIGYSSNNSGDVNFGAHAGVGYGKNVSLMGASIGTGGSKPSLSVGGATSGVYNSRANTVNVKSDHFQVDIPIGYTGISLRLARDYQRYWIDETATVSTFGSIYSNRVVTSSPYVSYDTYDLPDLNLDRTEFPDEEKHLGGSFPDFDMYTVMAQGVSGNMQPYSFQQHLFRQDKKDGGKILLNGYALSDLSNAKPVEYRFINDFSNRLEYMPNDFNVTIGTFKNTIGEVSFDFNNNIITGENGNDGYTSEKNHLAGSKHIEWYTNQEILEAQSNTTIYSEGFINCSAEGFQRGNDSQVGGYSITNTSGITYHYALPAYSYDEYMKTVNSSTKQITDGERWSRLDKPKKYAYTWFLTAVTGPDFVDKNGNGLADHGDWGYWVNFEYKKWLADYKWRNPGEGTNRDLDGEFESFASGKKEIYYLDKIITQSHVAVFEKSERYDGRETIHSYAGGFDPSPIIRRYESQCMDECYRLYCPGGVYCDPQYSDCSTACDQAYPDQILGYAYPRSTLKLDKIKLYNYNDQVAGRVSDEYTLRTLDFTYDYSLTPGTPNSYLNSYTGQIGEDKLGKLTLRSLTFLGKGGGIPLIPPMTFGYKNTEYKKDYVDNWGFYKSDFDTAYRDRTSNVIGRSTTDVSALDVDAWSLNEIGTSTGASILIDYESDQYDNVVLTSQDILRTKSVTEIGNMLKLTFWEENINLEKYFSPGDDIEINLVGSFVGSPSYHTRNCTTGLDPDFIDPPQLKPINLKYLNGVVQIESVNAAGAYVIVSNEAYYNMLKNETKVFTQVYPDYEDCAWIDPNDHSKGYGDLTFTNVFSGAKAWPSGFPSGIVSFPFKSKNGGGLRVNSITLKNDPDKKNARMTKYEYSGGTTSFEPFEIPEPKIDDSFPDDIENYVKLFFKRGIYQKFQKQIGLSRKLPGPGIMYKDVKVREINITEDDAHHELPNYTQYEFETYKIGMVDVVSTDVRKEEVHSRKANYSFDDAYLNKVILKDFSSRVGNLKRVTLFKSADNQPVSTTINNYLHDDLETFEQNLEDKFLNQGVVEETYTRSRIVLFPSGEIQPYYQLTENNWSRNDEYQLFATIGKLETYPSIQIGQRSINYTTGVENTSENLAFDFYSGEVTKVLTTDSYGNKYMSVSVPAYRNYSGMGLKVTNNANRNMLSQTSEQYSYVVDASNAPTGVLSASIQTWSDKVNVLNLDKAPDNIWRPQYSYQWSGDHDLSADGSYPYTDFTSFNWDNFDLNAKWQKTAELTLYDIYSHGLEAKDLNENYASTRMNIDQTKVIASTANARYVETAYTGAEYYSGNTEKDGGVDRGQGNPSRIHVHTGESSLLVATGNKGFNYSFTPGYGLLPPTDGTLPFKDDLSKKYRTSVWVYAPGDAETQADLNTIELYYTINGHEMGAVHPTLKKNKANSWYLLSIDITPDGNSKIYVGVRNGSQRGVYFDDFRFHPLNTSMTSYVYDSFSGELTYMLDGNNLYTHFEYDAMGRLIKTSKELLNFDYGDGKESDRKDAVLSEMKYNYGKKGN